MIGGKYLTSMPGNVLLWKVKMHILYPFSFKLYAIFCVWGLSAGANRHSFISSILFENLTSVKLL